MSNKTTEQFINEAKLVHENKYDYRKSDFENMCNIIDSVIKEKEVKDGE